MKKLLILFSVFVVLSCSSDKNVKNYTDEEKKQIDSVVRATSDVDSLCSLVAEYETADNHYGMVVGCRELGRKYRNTSRFTEAMEIHKKGLSYAELMLSTICRLQ